MRNVISSGVNSIIYLLYYQFWYTDTMNTALDKTVKQVANELITLSQKFDEKMERWSDVATSQEGLNPTEYAGFINKAAHNDDRLSFVIDVQAPDATQHAILRVWAIETALDEKQNERFNNIQLTFGMDYKVARTLAQKTANITRDDLRAALGDANTQLAHVVVSNRSGLDKSSEQILGERYDFTAAELAEATNTDAIAAALQTVLAALKQAIQA